MNRTHSDIPGWLEYCCAGKVPVHPPQPTVILMRRLRPFRLAAAPLLAAAFLAIPSSAAQAQTHLYTFQNSLNDAFAGPALTGLGGTLSASGYTFIANQGLGLSGVFSTNTDYSIAFNLRLNRTDGFRKIVDFRDRLSDIGYYNQNMAANLFPAVAGPASAYTDNTMAFTVLTRNATSNLFSVYVNGVLQLSYADASGYANFTVATAYFFVDDYVSGGEASGGFVDYLATYDRALSAREVADLRPLRSVVPEPTTNALVAVGLAGMFAIFRRRRTA